VPQTNVVIKICPVLVFTLYNTNNIAYHITEELIFYAEKIMAMGNSKNCTYLISRFYSNRADAHEIYMFCSINRFQTSNSNYKYNTFCKI